MRGLSPISFLIFLNKEIKSFFHLVTPQKNTFSVNFHPRYLNSSTMPQRNASGRLEGLKNYVENIAIVGVSQTFISPCQETHELTHYQASGTIGKYMVQELLKTNKHKITAITRLESTNKIPDGVYTAKVNYDDKPSLVSALKGQDVLIITMAATAPKDQQTKLIEAAAEAKVPWILPNEYSADPAELEMQKDIFTGTGKAEVRKLIESLGVSAWIGLSTSFWYEFSLGGTASRYGFDFPSKTVTFFDGTVKINTSTLDQCGRAVAALFSLRILPDNADDKTPVLSQFKNKTVYISSFLLNQRDMFDSVLRVTGDSEKDWTIKHEDVKERYKNGVEKMQKGNMFGFAEALYARIFYPDGCGDYESKEKLHNKILGLPKEDLDEYTKIGIGMAKSQDTYGLA